jgi:Fe-S-cluster-containing hydrogenase component 2
MPGVKYSGRLSDAELAGVLPPLERLTQGPVAVIECVQPIPCNPCEKACPFGAITVGEDITALPVIDRAKCKGCGLCISRCPGLAIFVVDASGPEATVMLPYEYLPLPAAGDTVEALDRGGKPVGAARILKVNTAAGLEGTAVVTLAVPRELAGVVRNFRLRGRDEVYICRCNEVSEAEIRQAVREGATTVAAVKLATRAGMGLCQGRTCRRLVSRIIAEETGRNPADIMPATLRPPVRTLPLGTLAGGEDDE